MKLWMIVPFSLMIVSILLWNTINEKIDQDICNAVWDEITDIPTDLGLAFEEVRFTTSDGIELGRVNTKGKNDEGEVDERFEHDVEFVKAGENAAKTFESAEKSFNFIATFVDLPVIIPRIKTV